MNFAIIPAIDLRAGRVVRLQQGDYQRQTVYGDDPHVFAARYAQAGGGVRDAVDVRRLLDAGATRVVVGSIAVRDRQTVIGWLRNFGAERLVIALDARQRDGVWRLPTAGWTQTGEATLDERVQAYAAAGARHLLCTDIDRDGMLGGLNIALYRHLAMLAPTLAVQASGGVHDLDDLRAARAAGAAGVILGRALLEGRFTLAQALTC